MADNSHNLPDTTPTGRPGETAGWPKLVISYPTDPAAVEALLPPGMEPWGEPTVTVGVYCVPVNDEPEYGISTKIPATWNGVDGHFSLGIGIDQEAAIFVSRDTNGQPKFPCSVKYFRLGDTIEAHATHQGHTFLSYVGTVTGDGEAGAEVDDNEWWVKCSPAVGGGDGYDFPPHVVRVNTTGSLRHVENLDGELTLRSSPWDPIADLLPARGPSTARLTTTQFTGRSVALDGALDPVAFQPHVETIGGSRWPGTRGGPKRPAA